MTKFTHVPMNSVELLVERLGVGGSGGDVGVTSGLVGAGGLLEGLGGSQVGVTGGGVLGGVVGETGVHGGSGKSGEHDCNGLLSNTEIDWCIALFLTCWNSEPRSAARRFCHRARQLHRRHSAARRGAAFACVPWRRNPWCVSSVF